MAGRWRALAHRIPMLPNTANGNDIVVWVVIRAHHEPRNQGEELVILPYHFHELSISPRNFRP